MFCYWIFFCIELSTHPSQAGIFGWHSKPELYFSAVSLAEVEEEEYFQLVQVYFTAVSLGVGGGVIRIWAKPKKPETASDYRARRQRWYNCTSLLPPQLQYYTQVRPRLRRNAVAGISDVSVCVCVRLCAKFRDVGYQHIFCNLSLKYSLALFL